MVPNTGVKRIYFPYGFTLWNISELLDGVSGHKMAASVARKFEKVRIYVYFLCEFFLARH